jgi:hypothetical protein
VCIVNVSAGSHSDVMVILNSNGIPFLVGMLEHADLAVFQVAMDALENLAIEHSSKGSNDCCDYLIEFDTLTLLEKCVDSSEVCIRRDACLALSNIAGSTSQHVVSILEHPQ